MFLVKKVTDLMEAKDNDVLSQIYLNHYGRVNIPILQRLLRMIYDYFTLKGIYVPLVRDERPFYSLEHLLIQCLEKKRNYLTYPECDLTTFDNAYANILCIQIFGQPLTILINDLSNGKLPVPYGIQNHLCTDAFHPETFYVTFHVLKTILLTLPNCISLATYLSYLNLLLGESFLDNMYTDASFSLLSRIHPFFFDKIIELQEPIDVSGQGMFPTALPDFLVIEPVSQDEVPTSTDQDEVPTSTDQDVVPTSSDQDEVPTSTDPNVVPTSSDQDEVPTSTDPNVVPTSTDPNEEPSLTDKGNLDLQKVPPFPPLPPVDKPFLDQPGAAAGGTRRYRRYKSKTKRQTLNKRFKKNRTRRLHGLHV